MVVSHDQTCHDRQKVVKNRISEKPWIGPRMFLYAISFELAHFPIASSPR